jgi:hypothetical protein
MPDHATIIEDSITWAQQIMAGYDAQALDDLRNRAAEQQARHAAEMARLEFERQRNLALVAFCSAARVDFEAWLRARSRGINA